MGGSESPAWTGAIAGTGCQHHWNTHLTRQKVIAIEKGDLSVGMMAYARVLAALDAELNVVPAVMPTLDEIHAVFD